jgi:hypothetical protein
VRKQKHYFRLTLSIALLVGILLPLAITSRPVDWKWFFYIMAMAFTLVWLAYSIILFGYVFLVEGRRNRRRLMMSKEEESFPYKVKGINGQEN